MDARRGWLRSSSSVVLLPGTWSYAAAANGQDWGPWGMPMMWGSWGIGMMLMMFLFWAMIIVAIKFSPERGWTGIRKLLASPEPEAALSAPVVHV